MTKPTDTLRWSDADPASTRDEPSSGEKDTGWVADEIPTSGEMNWLVGVAGDWITFIEPRFTSGGIKPTDSIDVELTAATGYLNVAETGGTKLPIRAGNPPGSDSSEVVTVSHLQGWNRRDVAVWSKGAEAISSGASPTLIDWGGATEEIGQGIGLANPPNTDFVFNANGIYHVDATVEWGAEVAADYYRKLTVIAPLVTKFVYNRAETNPTASDAQSQHISFCFKVTTYATDVLQVGVSQESGSPDGLLTSTVSIHWVCPLS